MFYLNNVQNFKHSATYGSDAFYDLRVDQRAEREVLRVDENYCVFSYEEDGKISLKYWKLMSIDTEAKTVNWRKKNYTAFALRGKNIGRDESMTKPAFASMKPTLFNRLGHFKQFSIAIPSWHSSVPRGGIMRADASSQVH